MIASSPRFEINLLFVLHDMASGGYGGGYADVYNSSECIDNTWRIYVVPEIGSADLLLGSARRCLIHGEV